MATDNLEAALMLGEPYDVGMSVSIQAPTLRKVIEFGQEEYYHIVGVLTAISSDCKAPLWDMGLDWVDITDMQMFAMSTLTLTAAQSSILLCPAIDFTSLSIKANSANEIILCDTQGNIVFDNTSRERISRFLCKLHNIVKKPERPYNKYAHDQLIEESRIELNRAKNHADTNVLWPLISYVANAPGSKYNYESCLDMRISTFMDCISRLQIIGDASALRDACYSGMIDSSKVKKEHLNAMREITPPKPRQVIKYS